LGVGVLGGFTTFSAYSLETMRMIERNDWVGASTYSIGSVIAGLIAVAIGLAMAKRVLG
ncbi:MAG: fluoride efflux transporter CrcB, partial [Alphaproteobacteria bacterium]